MRQILGIRKIGHAGTLDPFAEGLLLICFGHATRLIRYMEPFDKRYRATVVFGRTTDTQDLTGQTVFENQPTSSERNRLLQTDFYEIIEAVNGLKKITRQVPPMYSAVKVKGRPLYTYARRGEEVDRPARPVKIYDAAVESIAFETDLVLDLTIHCSKGTYIRSLADHLGRVTGWGAYASALTRIQSGPYRLEQAVDLESISAAVEGCSSVYQRMMMLEKKHLLQPAETAVEHIPRLDLERKNARKIVCGQSISVKDKPSTRDDRLSLFYDHRLIAIATLDQHNQDDGWTIRAERVLHHADLQKP